MTDARWRVGIDAGGTFTDVCLCEEETGALRVAKVPSTPDNPSRAITTGLERILQDGGRGRAWPWWSRSSPSTA